MQFVACSRVGCMWHMLVIVCLDVVLFANTCRVSARVVAASAAVPVPVPVELVEPARVDR